MVVVFCCFLVSLVLVYVLFWICFSFCFGLVFSDLERFKGQLRWPEGPPHLALNPPYFFCFLCFLFGFVSRRTKNLFYPEKGHFCIFLNLFSLSLSLYLSSFVVFLAFFLACFLFFLVSVFLSLFFFLSSYFLSLSWLFSFLCFLFSLSFGLAFLFVTSMLT